MVLGRMGTISKGSNSEIAIMAECSESQREIIPLKPSIKLCPTMSIYMLPVLDSSSVNVVDTKEFYMGWQDYI